MTYEELTVRDRFPLKVRSPAVFTQGFSFAFRIEIHSHVPFEVVFAKDLLEEEDGEEVEFLILFELMRVADMTSLFTTATLIRSDGETDYIVTSDGVAQEVSEEEFEAAFRTCCGAEFSTDDLEEHVTKSIPMRGWEQF